MNRKNFMAVLTMLKFRKSTFLQDNDSVQIFTLSEPEHYNKLKVYLHHAISKYPGKVEIYIFRDLNTPPVEDEGYFGFDSYKSAYDAIIKALDGKL